MILPPFVFPGQTDRHVHSQVGRLIDRWGKSDRGYILRRTDGWMDKQMEGRTAIIKFVDYAAIVD